MQPQGWHRATVPDSPVLLACVSVQIQEETRPIGYCLGTSAINAQELTWHGTWLLSHGMGTGLSEQPSLEAESRELQRIAENCSIMLWDTCTAGGAPGVPVQECNLSGQYTY